MRIGKLVKLFVGFCMLALLFGLDYYIVVAYDGKLSVTLLRNGSLIEEDSEDIVNLVKPGHRVVGGKPAAPGDFPYQASIQKISFFGRKSHYCGAAIISEYCAVTAAHCLDGKRLSSILIRVGSNTLRNDPLAKEYEIGRTILHPKYEPSTIRNDIGIVQLKKKLDFKFNINKVKLANYRQRVPEDTRCIVSGWGSLRESTPTIKTLMYADVPIMNDELCRKNYGDNEIYDTMMCAGYREGGTDSCQGDSGGPLVCNGKLEGIVSWGIGCARSKYPGVYTEVSYYTKWLESFDCSRPASPPKVTTIGSFLSQLFRL